MERRDFLSLLGRAVPGSLTLPWAAGAYAVALEPAWIETNHLRIPIPGLPQSLNQLRIVQISDVHRSDIVGGRFVREAVEKALALEPELVALTGDFISRKPVFFERVASDLAPLAKVAPAFGVPGNHDYDLWYPWAKPGLPEGPRYLADSLDRVGIRLLRNENLTVPLRGGTGAIELVGVDDLWSGHCKPSQAFANCSTEKKLRLVLCHNPDGFAGMKSHPFDLMLAGHTHGGQVRLPFWGALFCPVEDRRFLAGLANSDGKFVYTNRGLGFNRRIRFGVRPEITLLELFPA